MLIILCFILSGGTAFQGDHFGQGVEPTWMDSVECRGTEQRLADCTFSEWGVEDCSHSEDAGVRCGGVSSTTQRPTNEGLYNMLLIILLSLIQFQSSAHCFLCLKLCKHRYNLN